MTDTAKQVVRQLLDEQGFDFSDVEMRRLHGGILTLAEYLKALAEPIDDALLTRHDINSPFDVIDRGDWNYNVTQMRGAIELLADALNYWK